MTPSLRTAGTLATPPPSTAALGGRRRRRRRMRTAACKPEATFPPLLSPLTTLVGVTTLRAAGESGRRRRSLGASRSDARTAAAAALTLTRARVPGGWRVSRVPGRGGWISRLSLISLPDPEAWRCSLGNFLQPCRSATLPHLTPGSCGRWQVLPVPALLLGRDRGSQGKTDGVTPCCREYVWLCGLTLSRIAGADGWAAPRGFRGRARFLPGPPQIFCSCV